ncbi:MAG: GNAT family N-acetyltransferase [Armatimonadota bacterium]
MIGPELSGNKVVLRPLRDDDLDRRAVWLNDPEIARLFTGSAPVRTYMRADADRWRQCTETDPKTLVWAIDTADGHHIGDVDIHAIDSRIKSAKLTILVGDKAYWNSGYGTDAITALTHHAFEQMRLDNIYLRVFDFNKRAIRCYEKCGFTQIGMVTSSTLTEPRPNEIHMMIGRTSIRPEILNANTFHA